MMDKQRLVSLKSVTFRFHRNFTYLKSSIAFDLIMLRLILMISLFRSCSANFLLVIYSHDLCPQVTWDESCSRVFLLHSLTF